MASDNSRDTNVIPEGLLRSLSGILKELGVLNFLVLVLVIFFVWYSTPDQKKRFIDTWFLLETENQFVCIIVIASILLLSLIGGIYFSMMLGLSRAENERVGKEKTKLQEMLISRPLTSSDKSPKKSKS